jgi:hypothetical protein
MKDRTLRIVKRQTGMTVGACACGKQFRSHIHPPSQAEWEITVLFHRHKCKTLPHPPKPVARVVAPVAPRTTGGT